MVRCRIVFFLLFVSSIAFSQTPTFPRFRLIQLQQSDTVGQMIMSDTANNAFWSSDLRVQDSVFYIFGEPYLVDSTRLDNDTLKYYQNGSLVGFDIIATLVDSTRLDNDTLKYYQNGSLVGFDLIVTTIDSTRLYGDTLKYFQNGVEVGYGIIPDDQQLSINGDTIFIENGNFVILPPSSDTSGYNRTFQYSNDTLFITDDNSTLFAVIPPNTDTSGFNRSLTIVNDSLYLTDDNGTLAVNLSTYLDNVDTSGFNRIFELIGDTLYIEDDSSRLSVLLDNYLDNTDTSGYNIDFSISGDTITLTDGLSTKTIILPNNNTDTSGYNQSFTLQDSILYLQDGNTTIALDIKETYDNTDTSGYNSNFSIVGNELRIADGNSVLSVDLSSYLDNTDTSGFNRSFTFSGDTLYITDDNSQLFVDLSPLNNIGLDTSGYNDTLYISSNILYLQDGRGIQQADLSPYLDNTDESGHNVEFYIGIDTLLYIRDDSATFSVDLRPFYDNTDEQQLSIIEDTIYLTNGGSVVIPYDGDSSQTNEIQQLSISNDTIFLSKDGFVVLPVVNDTSGYNISFSLVDSILILVDGLNTLSVDLSAAFDNTDDQQLTKSNDTLYLEDGGFAILLDDDPTNELQTLSIVENIVAYTNEWQETVAAYQYTIYLTNGDSVVFLDRYRDGDYDSTNELQDLSKVDDTIYISSSNSFVPLLDDDPTNELQSLIRQQDSLFLTQDGGIKFPIDSTRLNSRGDSLIYYDENGIIYKEHISTLLEVLDACYVLDTLGWVYDTTVTTTSNIQGDLYVMMQAGTVAEQLSTAPSYSIGDIKRVKDGLMSWKASIDSIYGNVPFNVYFSPNSATGQIQTYSNFFAGPQGTSDEYWLNNHNDSTYQAILDSLVIMPPSIADSLPKTATVVNIIHNGYLRDYGYVRITIEGVNYFYYDYRGGIGELQDAPTNDYLSSLSSLSNSLNTLNGNYSLKTIHVTPSYIPSSNAYKWVYQSKAHILAERFSSFTSIDSAQYQIYINSYTDSIAQTLTSGVSIFSAFNELFGNNWYNGTTAIRDLTGVNSYSIDVNGDIRLDSTQVLDNILSNITFSQEIAIDSTPILDTLSISLWQDFSNNILSMRTIYSDNLLITADSTGCIFISDTTTESQYLYLINDTLRITGSDSIVDLKPYLPLTEEQIQDTVAQFINAGLGIDISYDDVNNELLIESLVLEDSVYNNTGSIIYKGTPLYADTIQGNYWAVGVADPTRLDRMPVIAIAGNDMLPGETGVGLIKGHIKQVNTEQFNAGDEIWVAPFGGYTNVRPKGEDVIVQKLGTVIKAQANGSGIIAIGEMEYNLNPGNIFIGDTDSTITTTNLGDITTFSNYWTKVNTDLYYNQGNVGIGKLPFYRLDILTDTFFTPSSALSSDGLSITTEGTNYRNTVTIGNLNEGTGLIQSRKYLNLSSEPLPSNLAINQDGGSVGIRTGVIDSALTVKGGIRGTGGLRIGNYDFRTLQDTTGKGGYVLTLNSQTGVIELNTIDLSILENQEFVLTTSYQVNGDLSDNTVVSYLLIPKRLQGCQAIGVEFYTNPQLYSSVPDTFTVSLGKINLDNRQQLEFLQLGDFLYNPYRVEGAVVGGRYEITDNAFFEPFNDVLVSDSTIYALQVTDYVPSSGVLARTLSNNTFTASYHFTCLTTGGASIRPAEVTDTVFIDIKSYSYIDTIITDETLIYNEITTDTVSLKVDTTIISTIKGLIDSMDVTRLSASGDSLLYYKGGVLIGYDTLSKGNGIFQEKYIGDGITNNLQITAYNGLLPTDKEDILVYRNGLFIDSEYITSLDPATGIVQLSFIPEAGDRMMIVWFTGDVIVNGGGGLDSVFTDMYIIGNGTIINPLSIDTMYVASKSYVDNSIASSGSGDITGVNEIAQYGINGGAASGAVELSVDTTVIASKVWVNAQNFQDSSFAATKLYTPRNIGLTGNAVGSSTAATFDGTADVNIDLSSINASYLLTGTVPTGRLTGTYGINITGVSGTATKLATPRTITLGGNLSGSASFDGSSNITISTSVLDNSHNHTVSNITDLSLGNYVTLAGPQTITGLKTIQNRLLLDYLDENIIIGNGAGPLLNSTSDYNVLMGYNAYNAAQSNASYNVAIGYLAGQNDLGNRNVFIGAYTQGKESSGYSIQTNSVIIGYNSESGQYAATNEIVIGNNTLGAGSNTATVGNSAITKFRSGNYVFNVDQDLVDGHVLTYNSTAQEIQLEPVPSSQTVWVEDANYVYYDGTKNVGIGTSTPTSEFSIEQEKNGLISSIIYNTSNSPFARSGFTMQTGFNSIGITAYSDSSNVLISGIEAKSKILISTNNDNGLVFLPYFATYFYRKSIFKDSLLYIDNKIGINTTTPLYILDVNETGTNNVSYSDGSVTGIANFGATEDVLQIGAVTDDAYIFNNNADGNIYIGTTETTNPNTALTILANRDVGIGISNPVYKLHINGHARVDTLFYNGLSSLSDERLKDNIQPIEFALNKVMNVNAVEFNFKNNENKSFGVIAQEIEKVLPELVGKNAEGYKTVNYVELIPFLIKSIQEQQQMINELRAEIEKLK